MSKRKSRKPVKPGVLARSKRKFIITLGLLLCLLTTCAILATIKPGASPTAEPATTAMFQSQPTLAKEYLYAGGRLVATEEASGGPSCSYSISPQSRTFTPAGGSGTVSVSAQTGCSWNVSSNVAWITFTPVNGSGNGTVNYTVLANTSGDRSGALTIADKTFNVTQTGTNCSFFIDPTFQSFTASGGTGTVSVFSPAACTWTATSNIFWITILSGASGSGNGTVTYSVQNNTGVARANTMTIAGQTFTVSQAAGSGGGGGCSYAIQPQTQTFSSSAGAGSMNVSATAGCLWQALTGANWITINPATASGSGNGVVNYTVTANTSSLQRIGTIHILDQNLTQTVIQNGVSGGGGGGNGLTGEYFNYTSDPMCGTPALTRTDLTIDFDWGSSNPGAGVGIDNFLVRWTGQVEAPENGTYTFSVRTDDGVRLWVNNRLLVDKWFDQYGNTWTGEIQLVAGQRYDIRMDMYERGGGAEAHLWWRRPSMPLNQREIVPTNRLFLYSPTAQPLYEGRLEMVNCSTISGWALNRRQINTALNITIHADGNPTPLATVTANQARPDIFFCAGESNLHGFTFTVPQSLKDGLAHLITAKFSGTNVELWGTPISLICSGSGAPSTPNIVSATAASASQINIVWQDTSNNENGFIVQRSIDSGSYSDIQTINSPNVTTFSDMGLSAGPSYCYKVKAFNNAGQSAPSSAACATIQGGSQGAPPAPTGLTGAFTASPRQVALTWIDNSNNETLFQVLRRHRKPGGTIWSGQVSLGLLPHNTTAFSDATLLVNNYTYAYVVRARNDFGDSNPTNEVQVLITSGSSPICSTVSAFSGTGGSGSYGYTEGSGSDAKWRSPSAGATGIDPVSGLNALFVADTENHSIRMIYLEGPAKGNSILIAGSGVAGYSDGAGDPYLARFNYPQGIAAIKNPSGVVQSLLVADTDNNLIRRLLPPEGKNKWRLTYFSGSQGKAGYADGEPLDTKFNSPHGIAIGLNGAIYVADTSNQAVRLLNAEGYSATWYIAQTAFQPVGIAVSGITGEIYLSDQANHRICSVTEGVLVTLAGTGSAGYADGAGTAAAFNTPYYLAWVDSESDGTIYIADLNNSRIRVLNPKTKSVTTWAGSGASGYINSSCSNSQFNLPSGVAAGPSDELYVIEKGNNSVRKIQ